MRRQFQHYMLITALLLPSIALAQGLPVNTATGRFTRDGTQTSTTVTATPNMMALPSDAGALAYNGGDVPLSIYFAESDVTLTVAPHCFLAFAVHPAKSARVWTTTSGSTTLMLYGGQGLPAKGCVGS